MKKDTKDIIAVLLLFGFAFAVNAGIQMKGLYMDDLYLWSCYGEQTFWQYVFPLGGTRFRFLFYLASYLILGLVGTHITWLVPINIMLNALVAVTVYLIAKRFSTSRVLSFLCGILYLLSRMSYYQIGQVYGLMETLALWAAIGILYYLYCYLNEEKGNERYLIVANLLYFVICFTHERYMVLLPVFLLVLLLKRRGKLWEWGMTIGNFVMIQMIRMVTIGTISPAGTGGTDVADTFHFLEAVSYALSQVAYVFGINAGPEHLNGLSWSDSHGMIKNLVLAADIMLIILILIYLRAITSNLKTRARYLANSLLFLCFIMFCIASSSVTVRVELRWVYVSYTVSLLFLSYIYGVLKNHNRARIAILLFSAYAVMMLPVELFYREQYPNVYFGLNQNRYNSLAEETYERYGEDVFGKTIYMVGNRYEMSDFTARTFLKVYDKERKAEGTSVVFVDSIYNLGWLTQDAIVLREDVTHQGFQDITDTVKAMQCERVSGYYEDGWMDEEAEVRVMSGASGRIHLSYYLPQELTGKEVTTIMYHGKELQTTSFQAQQMEVDIMVAPNQIVALNFYNNFYARDAKEQRGEKRMSMIVTITAE